MINSIQFPDDDDDDDDYPAWEEAIEELFKPVMDGDMTVDEAIFNAKSWGAPEEEIMGMIQDFHFAGKHREEDDEV